MTDEVVTSDWSGWVFAGVIVLVLLAICIGFAVWSTRVKPQRDE